MTVGRRFIGSIGCAALLGAALLGPARPAEAITYGEPDDGRHPYVGHFVYDFAGPDGLEPDGTLDPGCSLTLVAPRLTVMAAHCVEFLDMVGHPVDEPVGVSFEEVWDPATSPVVYGEMHVSPFWIPSERGGDDLAVIVLDEPAGITPAELPGLGELDRRRAAGTLVGSLVDSVGYGSYQPRIGDGPPVFDFPLLPGVRQVATGPVQALTPTYLLTYQNPVHGWGGGCSGDSGGPVLDGDMLLAVMASGDYMCRASGANVRLDTPNAQAFLADMLSRASAP